MAYRIDPQSDRVYIEEFRRNPIGRHSPGLQRVLNTMRFDPTGRQVILICRKSFREWVLGEMPPTVITCIPNRSRRPFTPKSRDPARVRRPTSSRS